jgi:ribosome-associated protein
VNDPKPSKSANKRRYQALQELGEQLIGLSTEQLHGIDLDADLLQQVLAAKRMRAHGALRRQKQLIGKLMRHVDPQPIEAALERFAGRSAEDKRVFAQSERWRDRIADGGDDALQAFLQQAGQPETALEGLLREHDNAPNSDKRRLVRRRMFREIHRILSGGMQNGPS